MTSEVTADGQQVVLVVEDEVLIRMVISDYLRTCGYRVIEATSAEEFPSVGRVSIHISGF